MKERRRQEQFASSTVWGVHVVQDKNSKPMRTYSKTHVFGTILVCTTAVCKTSRCVDCPATMYTHWKINDAKQDGHMLSGSLQCYPVNRHPVHLEFFARLVGSTPQKVPLRDQIFGTMFCRGQVPPVAARFLSLPCSVPFLRRESETHAHNVFHKPHGKLGPPRRLCLKITCKRK